MTLRISSPNLTLPAVLVHDTNNSSRIICLRHWLTALLSSGSYVLQYWQFRTREQQLLWVVSPNYKFPKISAVHQLTVTVPYTMLLLFQCCHITMTYSYMILTYSYFISTVRPCKSWGAITGKCRSIRICTARSAIVAWVRTTHL